VRVTEAALAEAPPRLPAARRDLLLSVVSEISRTVAATLELSEVFSRVADAVRRVLPFDAMGVTRFEPPDDVLLYAIAGDEVEEQYRGKRFHVSDMSPALVAIDAIRRIGDAPAELDPAFPLDREVLAQGTRSHLFGPLRRGSELAGSLWFASRLPHLYGEEDEEVFRPLADLAALALEHERLHAVERERRRRRDVLEQLVPTLAKALDVREVFDQVSQIASQVIPHDRMALGLLDEDRRTVRIHALSGEVIPDLPGSIRLSDPEISKQEWEFEIVRDVNSELDASSERCHILVQHGIRSMLRIPIRLEGELVGALVFHSKTVGQYSEADVDIARRVADQVALALSHQRLAEEARRAADAREQALRLEARVASLTEELEQRDGFHRVIGRAKSWRDVLVQATKVALTETTVLLTGESGTGKEVLARALHRASRRSEGPFVALNCAALPDQLLESELFGYEKGAFTGAAGNKPGRLEQAAGGVLFLDEVGEMSPLVQAKFLRVLQEREFQRLGGTRVLKADVRVIAATNRDLKQAIARGAFREDLYYRLHVFEIHLPPLRERREDILQLTEHFLAQIGRDLAQPVAGVSREARDLLLAYGWPGNVRELRNALERAAILAEGGLITAGHLPIAVTERDPSPGVAAPAQGLDLEAVERTMVEQALKQAGGNKSKAAKLLGLTRAQLYTRLEKYGI